MQEAQPEPEEEEAQARCEPFCNPFEGQLKRDIFLGDP
jgi:hypothetical protein